MSQIGVISDTHGLLRPEAVRALEGSSLILHAGDVGGPDILAGLEEVAPVVAVRGNTDGGEVAHRLSWTEAGEAHGMSFYMLHILKELDLDPVAAGFDVVVYGHTHRPKVERRNGVLYLNPGSAGPRRFELPASVATLNLDGDGVVQAEILELETRDR